MRHVLLIDCSDRKGLVAKISTVLYEQQVNIISNREFVDPVTSRFFMRTEFDGDLDVYCVENALKAILPQDLRLKLTQKNKKRLVLLATKEPHCLGDILIRCAYKSMNATIVAVVSNHLKLESLVRKFDIPFHHISHKDIGRETHASAVLEVVKSYRPNYIVLAKYMRILPESFVNEYSNRIINIHHSFLPAFVGAHPYKQAYERGVKIIGATAHFVSADLDQGPIIGQDVVFVNHRYSARDMAAAGRDVEKTVLSKALNLVINESVFVNGNKTVVFD